MRTESFSPTPTHTLRARRPDIAQGGAWDVDGSGIQKIDEPGLASAIRQRVNEFNLQSTAVCVLLTLAFVLVPELLRAST